MPQTDSAVHRYIDHYHQVNAQLPGATQPWLTKLRENALDQFSTLGFPTQRMENWKYTRVNSIAEQNFTLMSSTKKTIENSILSTYEISGMDSYPLVFIDGQFQPQLSHTALPQSCICQPLSLALTQSRPQLQQILEQQSQYQHGFQALNTAFMQEGLYLEIPENIELDMPIECFFISTGQSQMTMQHLHNIIIIGTHSKVTFIERYISRSDVIYFTNTQTHIQAQSDTQINYYKIQEEGAKALHIGTTQVEQHAASQFTSHAMMLGGSLVRSDIAVRQMAEQASTTLEGLYLLSGRQHIDQQTLIEHRHPHCASREFYKGIIDDKARAVFNGQVIVYPDAQKIDAAQTNKNLLLSTDAEIDTKPQLEIYADDVRCAHGATVGQLNEDELFYLRARGIDYTTARNLLIYAFASEVLEKIELEPLRAYLSAQVLQHVPASQTIEELV